jgi:hypothetical protein
MYLQHPNIEQVWPTDQGWTGEVIFVISGVAGIGVHKHSEMQTYLDEYLESMQGEEAAKKDRVYVKFPGESELDPTYFQWSRAQIGDDEVLMDVKVLTNMNKVVVWEGTARVSR